MTSEQVYANIGVNIASILIGVSVQQLSSR